MTRPHTGQLTDFDAGNRYPHAPRHEGKVSLRNRDTGKVTSFYTVDAREILAQPNTTYEPANDGESSNGPDAA